MPYGVNNELGTGQAQILPQGASLNSFAQQLNEQKMEHERRDLYKKQLEKQNEKELYDVLGESLNTKNFNSLIQDKVNQSRADLANKIKNNKLSYGDVFLEAQKKAGELSLISNQFNKVQAQIDDQAKEQDKYDIAANTSAIRTKAMQLAYNDFVNEGSINSAKDYYKIAESQIGLEGVHGDTYPTLKFNPYNEQNVDWSYSYRDRNKGLLTNEVKGKVPREFYNVVPGKDERTPPTVTTKSENITIGDKTIPILSDEAYGFYTMFPSNRYKLNAIVKKNNPQIDLTSPEAEIQRRAEAYKLVDRIKPQLIPQTKVQEQPATRISISTGGNRSGELTINDVFGGIRDKSKNGDINYGGKIFGRFNALNADEAGVVMKKVKETGYNDLEGNDLFLKYVGDDKVEVYQTTNNEAKDVPAKLITTLTSKATNLGVQPSVKEKREVLKKDKKSDPLGIL